MADLRARVGEAVVGQHVVGSPIQEATASLRGDGFSTADAVIWVFGSGEFAVLAIINAGAASVRPNEFYLLVSSTIAVNPSARWSPTLRPSARTSLGAVSVRARTGSAPIFGNASLQSTSIRHRFSASTPTAHATTTGRGGILMNLRPGPVEVQSTRTFAELLQVR